MSDELMKKIESLIEEHVCPPSCGCPTGQAKRAANEKKAFDLGYNKKSCDRCGARNPLCAYSCPNCNYSLAPTPKEIYMPIRCVNCQYLPRNQPANNRCPRCSATMPEAHPPATAYSPSHTPQSSPMVYPPVSAVPPVPLQAPPAQRILPNLLSEDIHNLEKAADRAFRFWMGIRMEGHSIAEQREYLATMRELQKALRGMDPNKGGR